jgi:hypothetical protein
MEICVTYLPIMMRSMWQEIARIYSRGRMNSRPKRRISPADSCRKTLATIGGVSLGTKLEVAGPGVGIVRWTVWSGLKM